MLAPKAFIPDDSELKVNKRFNEDMLFVCMVGKRGTIFRSGMRSCMPDVSMFCLCLELIVLFYQLPFKSMLEYL